MIHILLVMIILCFPGVMVSAAGGIDFVLMDSVRLSIPRGALCNSFVRMEDRFFVTDMGLHQVYLFTGNGELKKTDGGFSWSGIPFNYPGDVTVSQQLNVYISDHNNHRIVRYDRQLNFISSWPGESGIKHFGYPSRLLLNSRGSLFFIDNLNTQVIKIAAFQSVETKFGGPGYGPYSLMRPVDMNFLRENTLIIYDTVLPGFFIYDLFGNPIRKIRNNAFYGYHALIVSPVHVFLINHDTGRMLAMDSDFKSMSTGELPLKGNEAITDQFIHQNRLYVLTGNGKIYIIQIIGLTRPGSDER